MYLSLLRDRPRADYLPVLEGQEFDVQLIVVQEAAMLGKDKCSLEICSLHTNRMLVGVQNRVFKLFNTLFSLLLWNS